MIAGALALGGTHPSAAETLTQLDESLNPLLAEFNAAADRGRFLAILSPRCPACIHGAEAIHEALIEDGANEMPIFIVWTPMYAGDDMDAARETLVKLRHPRVRHYYDAGNAVGRLLREGTFPDALAQIRASLPKDHFIAPYLARIPATRPEWDIYMFFDPGDRWTHDKLSPARWVRQLARFGGEEGGMQSLMWVNSFEAPPVEGDLATQIRALAHAQALEGGPPQE